MVVRESAPAPPARNKRPGRPPRRPVGPRRRSGHRPPRREGKKNKRGFGRQELLRHWFGGRTARISDAALAQTHLLPAFLEYLVACTDRDAVLAPKDVRRVNAGGGLLAPRIVAGERVVGTWRRTFERSGTVTIALAPFAAPDARARAAIGEAAERYAAFLDFAPTLVCLATAGALVYVIYECQGASRRSSLLPR